MSHEIIFISRDVNFVSRDTVIQCLQLNAGWDPSTARVLVRRFIDSECIGLGDAAVQGSMEPDRIEEDVDEEERAGGAGASRCVNYQREYPRIPLVDSKGGKGRLGVKLEAGAATTANARKRSLETVTDKEDQKKAKAALERDKQGTSSSQ